MSVRSEVYGWFSPNNPSGAIATYTINATNYSISPPRPQRGYILDQATKTTLTHDISDASNDTSGSGFTATLTSVSKPPSTTAEADGNGLGNFVIDTAASTAISDMAIIFTTNDLAVGLVNGLVTSRDGSNKPTSFEILPTAGGSANANRILDAAWATGYVDLEDSATGTETVRLTFETTSASTDLNLIKEGMVSGLSMVDNGGGYKVGDTIVLSTSGEAGDLADGTVGIGGSKTLLTVDTVGSNLPLGKEISIFVGGYGNNIKNPPMNAATQFIVIEQYGATPTSFTDATKGITDNDTYRGQLAWNNMSGPRAYIQFYVNTTGYFKDPDGVARQGIPANNFPFPETQYNLKTSKKEIPVYILPGQTWDARLILFNGTQNTYQATTTREVNAFIKYTLYDGPDALIAMRLLENGIPVKPENVDVYRKKLISEGYLDIFKEDKNSTIITQNI